MFNKEQKSDSIQDHNRWKIDINGSSRAQKLYERQAAIIEIRQDLYENGFLEVETPLLVKGTCPDIHIDSMQTSEGYLVTSTEYQIKRLIVGGFERLFTLTKNFRANDHGRYHSHEFTMLEWARAHETIQTIEEDAIRFIKKAFLKLHPGQSYLIFNNTKIDFLLHDWERISVREAFNKYLRLQNLHDFSLGALENAINKAHFFVPENFKADKILLISYLFDCLQNHLGKTTPTFLYDWPAFMTTSAPICSHDPAVAERSELYIGGIEIADGFPFLIDPNLQKKLFEDELKKREKAGKNSVIIDEKYLDALNQNLPKGAGMALGVDRLIMVLTSSEKLADVQTFAWEEL